MARRINRTFRKSPSNKSWAGFSTATIAVAGTTKILLGGFTLSNTNIDETILRVVGTMECHSDQVASSEVQLGAFGMIIVNDLAAAAGAASIPGSITDRADDGWFVYVPIVQRLNVGDSTGLQPDFGVQYHFDSKAKRKVDEGFQVVMMVENATAAGFAVSLMFRLLSMVRGT